MLQSKPPPWRYFMPGNRISYILFPERFDRHFLGCLKKFGFTGKSDIDKKENIGTMLDIDRL